MKGGIAPRHNNDFNSIVSRLLTVSIILLPVVTWNYGSRIFFSSANIIYTIVSFVLYYLTSFILFTFFDRINASVKSGLNLASGPSKLIESEEKDGLMIIVINQ